MKLKKNTHSFVFFGSDHFPYLYSANLKHFFITEHFLLPCLKTVKATRFGKKKLTSLLLQRSQNQLLDLGDGLDHKSGEQFSRKASLNVHTTNDNIQTSICSLLCANALITLARFDSQVQSLLQLYLLSYNHNHCTIMKSTFCLMRQTMLWHRLQYSRIFRTLLHLTTRALVCA